MNYFELITYLNNNHFYPNKAMVAGKDVIEYLWIEGDSILAREREARIRELLKDKPFKVDFFKAQSQIRITAIKKAVNSPTKKEKIK